MSEFADQVIPSLPPTLSGNGLFSVKVVVPNSSSNFDTSSNNPSTSYSNVIMDPAKIIGTTSAPYMNVALPSYVSTLYTNVYNVNNNLENDISQAAVDDRKYPTSFAVQQYVQDQIAGTQIIGGENDTFTVITTANNTFIKTVPSSASPFAYSYNGTPTNIALFWMDTSANAPRNGATKTVMLGEANYFKDLSGNLTGKQAFLYAGDNSFFINHGERYKYYQFVYTGDFLSFVQAYSEVTNSWNWLVTACMAVFKNEVDLSSQITKTDQSSTMRYPINGTFGNLNNPAPV